MDKTSSEDGDGVEVPKPKRERKKSRGKSGDSEKSDVEVQQPQKNGKGVDVKSNAEAPEVASVEPKMTKIDIETTPGKGNAKTPKGAVETLAVGVVSKSPGKDTAKSKTPEKFNKSPANKVSVTKEEAEDTFNKSPAKKVLVTEEEAEDLSKEID
eukprot:GFUD01132166.1.p2 GENE.GFUD01132166.1~~GFUD01132166.1.p2  ORF type:complete len:155 (+),score=52.93 GFUD01132166.1:2-466(+)